MTRIRRVVKRQYYLKTQYRNSTGRSETKYKRRYDRVVYVVQFPKGFDITDLMGRELAFERKGDTIAIRPRRSFTLPQQTSPPPQSSSPDAPVPGKGS